eukprot:UN13909
MKKWKTVEQKVGLLGEDITPRYSQGKLADPYEDGTGTRTLLLDTERISTQPKCSDEKDKPP